MAIIDEPSGPQWNFRQVATGPSLAHLGQELIRGSYSHRHQVLDLAGQSEYGMSITYHPTTLEHVRALTLFLDRLRGYRNDARVFLPKRVWRPSGASYGDSGAPSWESVRGAGALNVSRSSERVDGQWRYTLSWLVTAGQGNAAYAAWGGVQPAQFVNVNRRLMRVEDVISGPEPMPGQSSRRRQVVTFIQDEVDWLAAAVQNPFFERTGNVMEIRQPYMICKQGSPAPPYPPLMGDEWQPVSIGWLEVYPDVTGPVQSDRISGSSAGGQAPQGPSGQ